MKSVTPPPPISFYISDITNSSSFNGKIFRKKSMIEKLLDYVYAPCVSFSSGDQYKTSSSIVTKGSEKQF